VILTSNIRSFFRKLRKRRFIYEPLVEVRILKNSLLHNITEFKKYVPKWGIAPVLKANAYGHGLVEVAQILDGRPEVTFLVVDSYYEALVLRNERIRAPILVIGYTLSNNILRSKLADVSFTISSLSQLRELAESDVKQTLHIKIDTGMHRQGIALSDVNEAIGVLTHYPSVRVEGVCSHFSDADNNDESSTREQIEKWNECANMWRVRVPDTQMYHVSATAGFRFRDDVVANVGRLGIGLYGVGSYDGVTLQPALEIHTRVVSTRTISRGEHVGYQNTFTANEDMKVATIPVGYYEGVDRRLSNKGFVEIEGAMCPIVGLVSMNMTSVDVGGVQNVDEGTPVIVIGSDTEKENTISAMARMSNTIPYDILVHIPSSLRRTVI